MLSNFFSFMTVVLLSMFKFIAGPLAGAGLKLPITYTVIATITGMMLSVLLISFAGPFIKKNIIHRFWPPKVLFSKKNRRIVSIWKKYGMLGVAFLTPILLSPIVGTLIAANFGEKASRVIMYMFISALLWSIGISTLIYQLKQVLV
ncbi:MAG: hypothetical protein RL711_78 [Bacteroidota bacterium]